MSDERFEQIRMNLEKRSTEELLAIWQKNDRAEWSGEVFTAVEQILLQRGESLPKQVEGAPDPRTDRQIVTVVVTDLRMPFGSMVVFMVKWSIASIPAAIILLVIGALAWDLIGTLLANLIHLSANPR